MARELTVGSLFSGCGCFDLAFARAGFRVAWQVEIDRTARSVLARHFPDVTRHEDIRECGTGRKRELAPVDVICGGWPCQDLSVAGARGGITGERSGLFYELVRIARELRPRFLVFENVPGLFSSFTGEELPEDAVEGSEREVDETSDFEAVLSHLAECGFHGGWRVLDARHFGVPQSRQRIFGVFACDRAGADDCAEILALAGSVRWNPAAGGEAGADLARSLTAGTGSQGRRVGADEAPNLIPCLSPGAHPGGFNGQDLATVAAVFRERGEGHATYQEADAAGAQRAGGGGAKTANLAVYGGGASGERGADAALSAKAGTRQDFDTENLVAYQCHGGNVGPAGTLRSGGGVTGGVPFVFNAKQSGEGSGDLSPTLLAMPHDGSHANAGGQLAVCLSGDGDPKGRDDGLAFKVKARPSRGHGDGMAVCVRTAQTSANGIGVQDDAAYTLDRANSQAVCVTVPVTHTLTGEGHDASEDGTGRGTPIVTDPLYYSHDYNQDRVYSPAGLTPALTAQDSNRARNHLVAGTVRRLTPTECERLMGLPDHWTRYRDDGTEISDGPRYKMCGNGLVVGCAAWLAHRTHRVLRRGSTTAGAA